MKLFTTAGWDDYALLDSGDGMRLEKFGEYLLARPDPQAIWKRLLPEQEWQKADAVFSKKDGKEQWIQHTALPPSWKMTYKDLSFLAKLSPFKHTGVFPEQHLNWDFITDLITKSEQKVNVLNLFAYTGIASHAAAAAGASVTHVDASRPTIGWARENQEASGLATKPIRWILDDALKFVTREVARGNTYQGVIMDPPVYGHGPEGERWDFSEHFPQLVDLCTKVMADKPLFFIVNAYAISSSAMMLENVMRDFPLFRQGTLEVGELALEEKESKRVLSTGMLARWNA
jgi:23S rRNA (cytosine1962-C5)-methyltransferase